MKRKTKIDVENPSRGRMGAGACLQLYMPRYASRARKQILHQGLISQRRTRFTVTSTTMFWYLSKTLGTWELVDIRTTKFCVRVTITYYPMENLEPQLPGPCASRKGDSEMVACIECSEMFLSEQLIRGTFGERCKVAVRDLRLLGS